MYACCMYVGCCFDTCMCVWIQCVVLQSHILVYTRLPFFCGINVSTDGHFTKFCRCNFFRGVYISTRKTSLKCSYYMERNWLAKMVGAYCTVRQCHISAQQASWFLSIWPYQSNLCCWGLIDPNFGGRYSKICLLCICESAGWICQNSVIFCVDNCKCTLQNRSSRSKKSPKLSTTFLESG